MSIDAERTVIGGLVLDSAKTDYVFDRLPPACFQYDDLRRIYQSAKSMHDAGKPIDALTLTNSVPGGKQLIYQCAEGTPTLANYDGYIRIVADDWRKRVISNRLTQIVMGINPQDSAEDVLKEVKALIAAQEELGEKFDESPGMEYIWAVEKFVNELYAPKKASISTGYKNIDMCTGGLLPKSVYVIAGRTGEGKTALALNIAMRIAAAGHKLQYFTLEMPAEQLVSRVASMLSKIDAGRIRDKRLNDVEKQTITNLITQVNGECINFVDKPVELSDIRRAVDLYRPEIIVIDHLGLVKVNPRQSRFEAIGGLSRGIKQMALEKNIAVLEVVQMNRDIERRASKEPQLADLRESGDIEQDADGVFFMTTNRNGLEGGLTGGQAWDSTLYIKKNRHGRTGTVSLRWQPQYHSILEVETRYECG